MREVFSDQSLSVPSSNPPTNVNEAWRTRAPPIVPQHATFPVRQSASSILDHPASCFLCCEGYPRVVGYRMISAGVLPSIPFASIHHTRTHASPCCMLRMHRPTPPLPQIPEGPPISSARSAHAPFSIPGGPLTGPTIPPIVHPHGKFRPNSLAIFHFLSSSSFASHGVMQTCDSHHTVQYFPKMLYPIFKKRSRCVPPRNLLSPLNSPETLILVLLSGTQEADHTSAQSNHPAHATPTCPKHQCRLNSQPSSGPKPIPKCQQNMKTKTPPAQSLPRSLPLSVWS